MSMRQEQPSTFTLKSSGCRQVLSLCVTLAGDGLLGRFLTMLPFKFTAAQQRVLAEIEADLNRQEPMARLVQGDVGSGKTVIAVAALLKAIQAGWQGAMMAPTEVLAEQHYRSLCALLRTKIAMSRRGDCARRRREMTTML